MLPTPPRGSPTAGTPSPPGSKLASPSTPATVVIVPSGVIFRMRPSAGDVDRPVGTGGHVDGEQDGRVEGGAAVSPTGPSSGRPAMLSITPSGRTRRTRLL